jgi:hypothetical protein
MSTRKIGFGRMAAALVIVGGTCLSLGYLGWDGQGQAIAATAAEKVQGRQDLELITKSLQAVDVAYAAGNAAEAQARFAEALVGWKRVSALISAREAREQQLLFGSLANQLKTSVPAMEIKATVTGMLDELHDDIEAELK